MILSLGEGAKRDRGNPLQSVFVLKGANAADEAKAVFSRHADITDDEVKWCFEKSPVGLCDGLGGCHLGFGFSQDSRDQYEDILRVIHQENLHIFERVSSPWSQGTSPIARVAKRMTNDYRNELSETH